MVENIYKEWDDISNKLKNCKGYEYIVDTIDEQDANSMSKLCDLILQFDDEEKVFEKIQDFAIIFVPIPKVIDTLFLLLKKYPDTKEIQAQCVCCIASCNLHQNATYEKTDYNDGVQLILHAYSYVNKYFDEFDKGMFYRYCLQALRLFALHHDIYTDKITDIYNMCKNTEVDTDIIDVEHVYTQLKFRSCYNANKVFSFLISSNNINLYEESSLINHYDFIGRAHSILMYLIINEVHQQDHYIKFLKTGVKEEYKPIKVLYPYRPPENDNGDTFVNSIFMRLFEEFAPDNVMKKMRNNMEVSNEEDYEQLPFEYSKLDFFVNLGLGYSIFMYHLIIKFYKNMDEITELQKNNQ